MIKFFWEVISFNRGKNFCILGSILEIKIKVKVKEKCENRDFVFNSI